MNLTSWRFFFLAPVNPSFYSSIQIFHFSNARNTFYIHIVGRVDIFLKYLSSFVVSTIYIFNQFIPLRIKYSSMFCFSAFKRFFHSLDEISIKFTATIWKFKSFFHAYFVYILYRNENSRIYIYIYINEWRNDYGGNYIYREVIEVETFSSFISESNEFALEWTVAACTALNTSN